MPMARGWFLGIFRGKCGGFRRELGQNYGQFWLKHGSNGGNRVFLNKRGFMMKENCNKNEN